MITLILYLKAEKREDFIKSLEEIINAIESGHNEVKGDFGYNYTEGAFKIIEGDAIDQMIIKELQ